MFQRLISAGHRYEDILKYPYPLFFAFLREVSKLKESEFKDLVCATTAGSRGDSKLIKSILSDKPE